MREDVIIRKTGAAIGRALRGMIKGTMLAYEKKLPRSMAREHFRGFVQVIDEASQVQEKARRRKEERLDKQFQEAQPKPQLDRRARRKARLVRARGEP
jgi:hypothetical protein